MTTLGPSPLTPTSLMSATASGEPTRTDGARFPDPHRDRTDSWVGWWLVLCAVLVVAMIAVGGLTRLTGSGLSMTEWKPVTGFIPPMSEADWQILYDQYRATPEYNVVNKGFGLEGFKGIFWLEFIHRVLGRAVGLVFFLPLLAFAATGRIPWRRTPVYLGVFALGGLQGLMGWYMVKSGLVADPAVSPYRLAAHLGLAFLILGILVVMARQRLRPLTALPAALPASAHQIQALLTRCAWGVLALVSLTVMVGALVAGFNAGLMYNTFPLMNGQWVPDGLWDVDPWWMNPIENLIMIQFNHRVLGVLAFAAAMALGLWGLRQSFRIDASRSQPETQPLGCETPTRSPRPALVALLVFAAVQVVLGVAVLVLEVPLGLASLHQVNAAFLFSAALWVALDSQALQKKDNQNR